MSGDAAMLAGGTACIFAPMLVGMAMFDLGVLDEYSENTVLLAAFLLAIAALAMCVKYMWWMIKKQNDGAGSPRRHLGDGSQYYFDYDSQCRTCRRYMGFEASKRHRELAKRRVAAEGGARR